MKHYYVEIKGAGCLSINMEKISKWLPDNITELGFSCSNCGTAIYDSVSTICNCCDEDGYYKEEIKKEIEYINSLYNNLMQSFKQKLVKLDTYNEYSDEFKLFEYDDVIESCYEYGNKVTIKDYACDETIDIEELLAYSQAYTEFLKNKTISDDVIKKLEVEDRNNYDCFKSGTEALKEKYTHFSKMVNEFHLAFSIPKENDTFNKKYQKNIVNYSNTEISIEIWEESDLGEMEESLMRVAKNENGIYAFQ